MRAYAIVMNLMIALAYVGNGIFIAPSFNISQGKIGANLARIGGLLFFIMCALTHTELAVHAAQAPPEVGTWFTSWHGLIIHTVQAFAGWTFCVLGLRFLNVKITEVPDAEID